MSEWKETEYGLIASDWNFIPAAQFCLRVTDGTHDSPKEQKTGKHLITSKHIRGRNVDFENAYLISEDDYNKINLRSKVAQWDVIISMIGEYCGFCFVEKNKEIHYAVKNVGLFKTGDNKKAYWLYYFLNSKIGRFILEVNKSGTSQPYITLGALRELPILTPSCEKETHQIVTILSSLDDKIDLLHRQNKTLEELAETLFRQWFVVEADESWEVKTLSELILFDPRERISKSQSYLFFEMKCLSNTDMNISDGIYRCVLSGTWFRNYDTLLAKITPCLENGKTGFVMHLGQDEVAKGSTEFIVMRSKGTVSPYWVYCLARENAFREKAIQSMTGTSGRQRVQIDLLKNISVRIEQKSMIKFHKTVTPFFKKIKSNQNQIRTLTQLRDTLLPKLMNGVVRVKM